MPAARLRTIPLADAPDFHLVALVRGDRSMRSLVVHALAGIAAIPAVVAPATPNDPVRRVDGSACPPPVHP